MIIRKATAADLAAVAAIYEEIHDAEEAGQAEIGWQRGVYPTAQTARDALERDDLFVQEEAGRIAGAAIINQRQCEGYDGAAWRHPAQDSEVMVLHTLVISPRASGRGAGRAFVGFYEEYARRQGCCFLRMDTNERNSRARGMYARLGYQEIGIMPTTFNGMAGINLVLLEKAL